MKKVIALLLVFVFCLSLCACGGGTMTKEEMISTATTHWHEGFVSAYNANPEEAEKSYIGKIIKFVARVDKIDNSQKSIKVNSINSDYKSHATSWITLKLPAEEMAALSVGDRIAVVGEITRIIMDGCIYMDNVYIYPIIDCIADQVDPMIELFGKYDGDTVKDKDESTAFFIEFKEDFPLLTGEEIKEKIVGTWYAKDTFGAEFEYTFNADGTSMTTYDGKKEDCTWILNGDSIYLDVNGGKIDPKRAIRMEVRQLNENSIILYEDDFNEYNGHKYKMESASIVFVRK